MSHERSTPSSPGSEELASSPTPSKNASPASALRGDNEPIAAVERWAMRRGESSFHALSGATGGFISGVVTCPLDVIKTKLQAQGGFRAARGNAAALASAARYNGMLGTANVIWSEEGLKGLYRGLGPIIMGYLPTWAVWFTVYGKSKQFFQQYNDNENIVNFCSSIVAGGSSTMVTNPIWVIKTRLMSQVSRKSTSDDARPAWHYRSTFDAARKMYTTEGFLSFYSGLTPALLGLTHVAVQFPAYEYLKRKFTGQGMGESEEGNYKNDWVGILSASVLSKVLASCSTYPHEVIRTRLQTQQRSMPASSSEYAAFRGGLEGDQYRPSVLDKATSTVPRYKGIVTTFQMILKEEGWRAFYAGMGTNMMRAVPAATTTMLTYEYCMRTLGHAKLEGIRKTEEAIL
ncbi:mitochondrial folate transporter-like protein/carrier [Amylocarpus encephaloides]|uniref:Mitochondrial folate transporter-like protein/carrier n=1 Tax=Amylocarpus encephaloides TaxID=45428 RepID=A0A9P8C615_9HELO|nr:mitochondrial folate transporter-like protein/carrier [Amylocarpus encephaloides]